MRNTIRIIALALSLALIVASLSACSHLIQPSRKDIARANFSCFNSPVKVQTEIDLVSDSVAMYYDTSVICLQKNAAWDGTATVFYNNTYFKQECVSQTNGDIGAKQWRKVWAKAETGNPILQLCKWMEKVEAGLCSYETVPDVEVIDGEEQQVYLLSLRDFDIEWSFLCDANLDSLFGGDDLLSSIGTATVEIKVDAESLLVRQIHISAVDDIWLDARIVVSAADNGPHIQIEESLLREGVLNEEWSILGSVDE